MCKVLSYTLGCNHEESEAMAASKGPFTPVQKKTNWGRGPRGGKTEVTYPHLEPRVLQNMLKVHFPQDVSNATTWP